MNGWKAFDQTWFKKNQKFILSWVNGKGFKRWFSRYVLRLDTKEDLSVLEPHFYTVCLKDGQLQSTFRTHWKYAKRVYFAFLPIWWALHFVDWVLLDKFLPEVSFGFDTLTAYPQAGSGGGNTTCDGWLLFAVAQSIGTTWAVLRDNSTGTTVNLDSTGGISVRIYASEVSNKWTSIYRSGYAFDTSAIGSGNTVSDATFSTFGYGKANTLSSVDSAMHVVSFSPASSNSFVAEDYDQFGTTTFGSSTYASLSDSTYTNFTLNAAGLSNISKTSVTKFGQRFGADLNNTEPTYGSLQSLDYFSYYADNTGTTNDPKLVVTYAASPNNYKQSAVLSG